MLTHAAGSRTDPGGQSYTEFKCDGCGAIARTYPIGIPAGWMQLNVKKREYPWYHNCADCTQWGEPPEGFTHAMFKRLRESSYLSLIDTCNEALVMWDRREDHVSYITARSGEVEARNHHVQPEYLSWEVVKGVEGDDDEVQYHIVLESVLPKNRKLTIVILRDILNESPRYTNVTGHGYYAGPNRTPKGANVSAERIYRAVAEGNPTPVLRHQPSRYDTYGRCRGKKGAQNAHADLIKLGNKASIAFN